ncbi:hypothetical protein F4679DRAFT_270787 [Xylaria curta]|nr:hypothetical protein F4679DRAFT_270787 [Xylaria curta]
MVLIFCLMGVGSQAKLGLRLSRPHFRLSCRLSFFSLFFSSHYWLDWYLPMEGQIVQDSCIRFEGKSNSKGRAVNEALSIFPSFNSHNRL